MPPRLEPSQKQRAIAFGQEIQRLRNERGMSQTQLAELVHLSGSSQSRLESGKYAPPSDERIALYAKALEADYVDLMRVAGRELDPASFQQRVLADLKQLRSELRVGFERLEARIADSDDR